MKKEIKELLEDLEMLIINNEDDFDRGKGKFILREFISSINSAQGENSNVSDNETKRKKCPWKEDHYCAGAEKTEIYCIRCEYSL